MPRPMFSLPQLPKPEYMALRTLCQRLGGPEGSTQLEVICAGIRIMADLVRTGQTARVEEALTNFRSTAPKEQPPLL